jgi:hypothetical protein
LLSAPFVTNNTDCNDANSAINPTTAWYLDADGDGYGTNDPFPGATLFCTPQGAPWVLTNTDCNDFNGAINPAATEVWENGIDDDCNPNTTDVSVDEWSIVAFNLFPNPATDRITLSLTSTDFSKIEIFNSLGALVQSSNVIGSQAIIDVSVFPAGYYVVRVNGLAKTFVKL